ncbi:MAG: GNAT family N-acetyltransferase [Rhizobiaceae bacterium]|nr:GNAT family N-acetyltransferase [Rhizobiaceae bacterium]
MTGSSITTELPVVRRLEAVSFRSWPATNTIFDGTWAIRLTASHPSKRVNSVNPLDRGDQSDLENRVARAAHRFQSFGRPLVFRQSPLAPPQLDHLFDAAAWRRFDETRVMTLDLEKADLAGAVDQLPLRNIGRWIDQCVVMASISDTVKPGLSELIGLVEGEVGLFLQEDGHGVPLAAAMAVRFGDLVGLFEIVSNPDMRQLGLGRRIVRTALLWARNHGARHAWLQVVSDNQAANRLYESEGFSEVYRYEYRQAPEGYQA